MQFSHIHAIVTPARWNQIGHHVQEGHVYIVRNFRVLPPQGRLRPVRTSKCISFLDQTIMYQVPGEDLNIRLHKFEIVPLDNLADIIVSEDADFKPLYATGKCLL